MDTVYPASASALARGRRLRRGPQRARTRTTPVTFAEIKEVDEEGSEALDGGNGGEERRRGRDELAEDAGVGEPWRRPPVETLEPPLHTQFSESRRRRKRRDVILEPPEEPQSSQARASSEPRTHGSP